MLTWIKAKLKDMRDTANSVAYWDGFDFAAGRLVAGDYTADVVDQLATAQTYGDPHYANGMREAARAFRMRLKVAP